MSSIRRCPNTNPSTIWRLARPYQPQVLDGHTLLTHTRLPPPQAVVLLQLSTTVTADHWVLFLRAFLWWCRCQVCGRTACLTAAQVVNCTVLVACHTLTASSHVKPLSSRRCMPSGGRMQHRMRNRCSSAAVDRSSKLMQQHTAELPAMLLVTEVVQKCQLVTEQLLKMWVLQVAATTLRLPAAKHQRQP